MINNKRTVAFIISIIAAVNLMAGCGKKPTAKVENTTPKTEQTEQSSTSTGDKQQDNNGGSKEAAIQNWKFNVPEGYEAEDNGGPWYEKRYANKNGAVLLFGYYEPNGIDKRTDKQIFDEQANKEEDDLTGRYGSGEVTYKNIDNDKMCITVYYETRDLKVLVRSILNNKVWKTIYVEIPISENEKNYENILDEVN